MFGFTINQVDLLRQAIRPFADLGDRANINFSPDFIMLQTSKPDRSVIAVLLIKSESVENFICSEQEGCVGIQPSILHDALNDYIGAEWSLTIYADENVGVMHLFFKNVTQGLRNHHLIEFERAPYGRLGINHLRFGFKAVVVIRSSDFQDHLELLSADCGLAGNFQGYLELLSADYGLAVNVYITHNQMKLSSNNKEIVLTKETGECIIGGADENDQPIEFSFSLEHMAAYKNALVMSSMVSIQTPSTPGGPFMLKCPAGALGNIMFLFPPNI